MAMTYNTLATDLVAYTANNSTDFANRVDEFVTLAESRIRRDLIVPEQMKHTTGAFADGTATYTLPTDFIRSDTLFYETATADTFDPVRLVQYSQLQLFAPDRVTTSAVIRWYARYNDTEFIVAPTPNGAINYRLSYIAYEPRLDAVTVTTNWITDNAPDALLAAALVEAFSYQRSPAMQEWESRYAAAVQRVNYETKVAEERDDTGGPAQLRNGRSM